jgi:hypothetical protein
MHLAQFKYPAGNEACWYGDIVKPFKGYAGSDKYHYRAGTQKFLRSVLKQLGLKASVKFNPGGPAVPGEAWAEVQLGETRVLYLCLLLLSHHAHLLYRIGTTATSGANCWIENPLSTAAQVAAEIRLRLSAIESLVPQTEELPSR